MKTAMIVKSGITAVAFLLISTAAIAQSAPAGRTSHSTIKPRDAQSGMATGKYQRKSGAIHSADYNRSAKDKAEETKSQEKKGDNPLYEGSGSSGTNPMYEPNRVNSRPKDPVQGQPGRSDRTSGAPLKGVAVPTIPHSNKSAAANGGLGPDVYQRKHIAGVKYENRSGSGGGSPTGAPTPNPSHKPK